MGRRPWDKLRNFITKYSAIKVLHPAECNTDIVRQIIIQHLYSPSMWAIFPIQDLLGMDENLDFTMPMPSGLTIPEIQTITGVTGCTWILKIF